MKSGNISFASRRRTLFRLFIMHSQNSWHNHWRVCDSPTQLTKQSSPLETSHLNSWCLKISFWRQAQLRQDATVALLHRGCQAKQLNSLHSGLPVWFLLFTYTEKFIMLSVTHKDCFARMVSMLTHHKHDIVWFWVTAPCQPIHILRFWQECIHPDAEDALLLLN